MNYQHHFHAGNFADIFKHLVLIFCLEKLHEKSSSFLAIDTHSGLGKYDINNEKSLKTNEFNEGLKKILLQTNFQEILPKKFLEILAKINLCNIDNLPQNLKYYCGSPIIIKNFLRSQDKAIFAETNHDVFYGLKRNFAGNKKILCTQENGFELTKSKLPSIEKRAIILIDSAFEKNHQKISSDYELAIESLQNGYKRCSNGIYLLWHPIIEGDEKNLEIFYQKILNLKFEKIHHLIFDVGNNSTKSSKMHACGMFVFNMPWQVDEKIKLYFPKILGYLKNSSGEFFELKNLK
ncbi:MAG: 23S rRNA (adenine(2030)-N(6))-methyltransferase RlmJ [Alphaproteobacteria bacterium]|nr:23S rRNA (adenine(2030)-N(6))-methyltransferase RlmJ [Alphaproteobacteria bacterium]